MPESPAEKKSVDAMRVDGPHVPSSAPATPAPAKEMTDDDIVAKLEPLELSPAQRRHLEELSNILRQQRTELERREAQLQSQMAAIDNEARIARLGVDQHAAALAERTKLLDRRERELAERDAALNDRQNEIEAQVLKLDQQAAKLEQTRGAQKREDARLAKSAAQLRITQESLEEKATAERRAVDRKLAEVKGQQAAVEKFSAQIRDRERQLDERQQTLEKRLAELDEIAAQLADAERGQAGDALVYSREQAELARERQVWEMEVLRQRELQEQARKRGEAELIEMATQLDQRQSRLEQRQAAVEKIEQELREKHREALESQLVVAELWPELMRHTPTAELTRRTAELRVKIRQSHEDAAAIWRRRQNEVNDLLARLEERRTEIADEYRRFQQWLSVRHEDLEKQAARLAAAERGLSQKMRVSPAETKKA
ncbi:hypothetical protein LOC68_16165 [Blastopirellula sp. JC732]|uniref:Uncharacterized protein n=1 Tax=Blastopirellula sediminis TaxID=2894196 RepID=A0A9X1MPA0_9BACT|nr:hypothetical protein [Blastopirellula sediminis]MCC9606776.1 hypothetical protein [Blastopirellula sediminis]MCC9629927.1 hypothetical protein [Blastopirellula sediminis]